MMHVMLREAWRETHLHCAISSPTQLREEKVSDVLSQETLLEFCLDACAPCEGPSYTDVPELSL